MRRSAVAFVLLFLAACGSSESAGPPGPVDPPPVEPPREPPTEEPKNGLPEGVFALSGVDAALPSDDLAPLQTILSGVEVAGFGETVHTSGGYSSARARIIRYLIEKVGYRAVSFEGPWGAAEVTRRYVEDGEGTLADAMRGLTFLAWRNDVTAGLVTWLREWNQAHADDRVRFFGFDIQGPGDDGKLVRSFLAKGAPAEVALADKTRLCLGAKHDNPAENSADPEDGPVLSLKKQLPKERHDACLAGLGEIEAHITEHVSELTLATSADEVEYARIALRAIRANDAEYFYYLTDPLKSYDDRDLGMADVFMRLRALRAPTAKTVIWAHNRHLTTRSTDIAPGYGDIAWTATGSLLGERLGAKYAPIGLFAYDVQLNWDGTTETVQPPRNGEDHLEKPLHALKQPYLLVDLQKNGVFTPGKSYEMGLYGGTGVPDQHYRALVYLEKSPAQKYFSGKGP